MQILLLSVSESSTHNEVARHLSARRCSINYVNVAALETKYASAARMLIVECSACEPMDKMDTIARFRRLNPTTTILVYAVNSSEDLAVAAFRVGVNDYFRWPGQKAELLKCIDRHLPQPHLETGADACGNLIGQSTQMRAIVESVRRAASTESNVLITGETGTGKEVVAQSLHASSVRSAKTLVPVNCAAIPDTLLESELFGHERGAFTGAAVASKGKLLLAHGGTIFFDEIGDMSLQGQAKLLRAVETREVIPLGGRTSVKTDTRVISATNQNLEQMVKSGGFRADLLFRLNVIRIDLPPLRERAADIPALLDHFVRHFNQRWGTRIIGFDEACSELLKRYDWPGNVRELKNVVEAVYVNSHGGFLTPNDLPLAIRNLAGGGGVGAIDERRELTEALFAMNWNVSRVAEKLHISRMTVYRKLERFQISRASAVTPVPEL